MKPCNDCGVSKNITDFQILKYNKKNGEPCYRNVCKMCMLKISAKSNRKIRRKNKEVLIELMGTVCTKCGKVFHPASMDIHHTDPTQKDPNWSYKRLGKGVRELLNDCVLLCSNCHRRVHAEINGWYYE